MSLEGVYDKIAEICRSTFSCKSTVWLIVFKTTLAIAAANQNNSKCNKGPTRTQSERSAGRRTWPRSSRDWCKSQTASDTRKENVNFYIFSKSYHVWELPFFLIVFNVSLSFRLFQEEMARLQNNLEKLKSQGSEDDIEEKVLLVEQVKQGTNCVGISSMSSLFFRKDWSWSANNTRLIKQSWRK